MLTIEQLQGGFTLGAWEVLPQRGVLRRGEEEVHPEPKVLAVLLALARRDGDLVTQDELIEEVWEGRAFGNEPIQRCIALLRKHFGDTRPYKYIETLQRRGYRLLQPVQLHEPQDIRHAELPDKSIGDARLWKAVAAVVAAGFLAVAVFVGVTSKEPAVRSIAILPMENLSGYSDNQVLVDGIKNSLAFRLAELGDFGIKNVRQFRDGPIPEIATALNVESLLFSSLQMEEDALKVTWHIVDGTDGLTIFSGEEIGNSGRVFRLQEQLAQAVRGELAGSKTPQLVMRREPESAAYNSFMAGMYSLERRGEKIDNLDKAIPLFEESVTLDEDFGPAYLALAQAYALQAPYMDLPLEDTYRLAVETVEKGISVDRSIEDAAASIYGFFYHQHKRWRESEEAHLQAVNAAFVDANSFNWYSRMLASVGRREDSLRWILEAEAIDPDNPVVINRIALVYMWLGETRKAQEYFGRSKAMVEGGRNQVLGSALLLLRLGDIANAKEMARTFTPRESQSENEPADWIEPVFTAFTDSTRIDGALDVLDRHWAEETLDPGIILIARTRLGDVEGAMEIAQRLTEPGEIFEMDLLFIDELEPLRLHPEFYPLMIKLGVVEYWESVGCLWEGSQVNCAVD
jgi:DNA-binding winged helix-turn-helix (wHTH) protein/tetratricopeptide (TPR) repeat protein